MKKISIIVFLCLFLLSCTDQPVDTLPEIIESPATDFQHEIEEDFNSSDTESLFNSVINEEKAFLTSEGEEIFLSEFVFPYSKKTFDSNNVLFAYVDMNVDGIHELVIKGDYGDKLILHKIGENVIGYSFDFRSIDRIYSDGTFDWNYTDYQGLHYGTSRLNFIDNSCRIDTLCSVFEGDSSLGDEQYYIGESNATKEDYVKYIEQFSNKEIEFNTFN